MRILFAVLFGILSSTLAWCFPEMVRHGYVNCTTCHVSPTGGGVLNPYGRQLSKEVLSTWGTGDTEEYMFAYGVVKPPEWLNMMGMVRTLYLYQNNPFFIQGQTIFMQGDLEASANYKKWTLDATLGYQNPGGSNSFLNYLISRRHFINYRPTDELSFRVGRFYPAFGIQTPDHNIPTKQALGWDQSMETYNVEAAWIGERWNLFLTGVLGRPDQPSLNRETGFAATPSLAIDDTYKVGLSYYYGNGLTTSRNVEGIWGILGFTHHLFLLTEWDLQEQSSKTNVFPTQTGAVNYQRFDYELLQGLHFYLTQDLSQLDFTNAQSLTHSYGFGTQFFPRPHFEINVSWQKQRSIAISNDYTDFAWAMLNFYL